MELRFRNKYINLSDKEIVEKIITEPYDEEAATFLIYDRYNPLCISICEKTLGGVQNLNELQIELFMLLKGKKHDWQALSSFQWRSTLGRWLSITAYNLSLKIRKNLIENDGKNISLNQWSNNNENSQIIQIPFDEEKEHERKYRMVLLQEAINKIENPDQQFVVRHRLHGYSSKEVADMLQSYWDKKQIVRYNNNKKIVVPNSGYVDNLFKKGYDKVIQIYKFLDR